ncbi:RagB/SusD family nutrient uptake outer membrane protein [Chitinophaga horti]|uniref:RagB/SusD family nutrient uptake outer membrane protein n=1 Tax=Chitinophaga horti TaxID=2920382 RepID=A0ABY6J3E7_9BACT|nr:RagB/SusD family nutrient uptake outer membrane protein [Chitinophaga horti]UYQ94188.1 RagB/SusD family nutrient uptake outer membrane protein [Chitinophaga horti]
MKMKRIYPLIYIVCLLLTACGDSFLDVIPQGKRIATNVEDYDLLMNEMGLFRDNEYAPGGWSEAMIMGDDAAASGRYLSTTQIFATRLFNWEALVYQDNDQPPVFLQTAVTNLYTFNKVIAEVGGAAGGTATQKAALRGEALASRAWTNLQLINYYAKPYAAGTAATDPGFPIITIPDATIQRYERGTVQQMYDHIIKDLEEAIAVLPVTPRIRTRFSKPAAEGLLGKVYVFMGRYADALPHLNNAFTSLSGSSVQLFDYQLLTGVADPNFGFDGPGNDPNNFTEDIVSKIFTTSPQSFFQLNNRPLLLAPAAAALYDSRDLRLKLYSTGDVDGSTNAGGLLRKYGVRYNRYGLQLPELYLLRAECLARGNNLPGAVADLEELRKHRMPAAAVAVPSNVAADRDALIRFVIDERTREFALQGYRWFDMRRLSVDPLFASQTFTHTTYNQDGSTTTVTMDQPNRLVMRIPNSFMLSNPAMQNNP